MKLIPLMEKMNENAMEMRREHERMMAQLIDDRREARETRKARETVITKPKLLPVWGDEYNFN